MEQRNLDTQIIRQFNSINLPANTSQAKFGAESLGQFLNTTQIRALSSLATFYGVLSASVSIAAHIDSEFVWHIEDTLADEERLKEWTDKVSQSKVPVWLNSDGVMHESAVSLTEILPKEDVRYIVLIGLYTLLSSSVAQEIEEKEKMGLYKAQENVLKLIQKDDAPPTFLEIGRLIENHEVLSGLAGIPEFDSAGNPIRFFSDWLLSWVGKSKEIGDKILYSFKAREVGRELTPSIVSRLAAANLGRLGLIATVSGVRHKDIDFQTAFGIAMSLFNAEHAVNSEILGILGVTDD